MTTEQPNSCSDLNVIRLRGGGTKIGEPVDGCVEKLRELLEQAEAGEIIGFACASLRKNQNAKYDIVGMIGPFSLCGAADAMKTELHARMMQIRDEGEV